MEVPLSTRSLLPNLEKFGQGFGAFAGFLIMWALGRFRPHPLILGAAVQAQADFRWYGGEGLDRGSADQHGS